MQDLSFLIMALTLLELKSFFKEMIDNWNKEEIQQFSTQKKCEFTWKFLPGELIVHILL